MDNRYEPYCLADPLFYDALSGSDPAAHDFPVARRTVPPGWVRSGGEEWVEFHPAAGSGAPSLPAQGWKVHVSACLDNAERVLDVVWGYCLARQVAFKFLRGRQVLLMRNAKYAPRGSSGKLVTIYPADEAALARVLTELGERLAGEPGPYILSDLRWRGGPLYVRYGGFARRFVVSRRGELVPAVADPDGRLVPDRRGPVFRFPEWVTLPAVLAPQLAARNSVTTRDLPYGIEQVIHFSNGGGLYVAVDERSGARVVLKEARPHAGLSADGSDAVTRLRREQAMLERLAGVDGVPAVHDAFTFGEHSFLVVEFVDGQPLHRCFPNRYPLSDPAAGPREYAVYADWARGVVAGVERIVGEINARGVVYGDLHLYNVLVRRAGGVALVDFEVAAGVGEGRRPAVGNPGFAAPRQLTGFDVDRYALACLRLAMFLPVTTLLRLDPGKAAHFAEIITAHFPLPAGYLDDAVRTVGGAGRAAGGPGPRATVPAPRIEPDPRGWREVRRTLASAIVASATPGRDDRLFPGDIEQFRSGGLSVGYGAAGALYALSVTGVGRFPEYEEWLRHRARRPRLDTRPGLYDGLFGVAYVLAHLGHRDDALDVVTIGMAEQWHRLGLDLHGGVAGIGLCLAHLGAATGESALTRAATWTADLVADRLGGVDAVPTVSGGDHPRAGLLRGSAGPALLLIRLFEHTGDSNLLDLAAVALRQDLRRCRTLPDGTMHVDEGWRTVPYLDSGSAGIGLVLDDYLRHRPDDEFRAASAAIRAAARSPFYVQPGLFAGRAGMIAYLARDLPPGAAARDPHRHRDVADQVRRLGWHAVRFRGHLAFPGEQLLRLSMDLGTGTAGVLLGLGAALHDEPVHPPLLYPARLADFYRADRSAGRCPAPELESVPLPHPPNPSPAPVGPPPAGADPHRLVGRSVPGGR